jgi:hypothetical protein
MSNSINVDTFNPHKQKLFEVLNKFSAREVKNKGLRTTELVHLVEEGKGWLWMAAMLFRDSLLSSISCSFKGRYQRHNN